MVSTDTMKYIALAGILAIAVVGAVLPGYMGNTTAIQYGNMFSAGVLMAAALVHIAPDAANAVTEALPDLDFPLSAALFGSAYLIMMILHNITRHLKTPAASEDSSIDRATVSSQRTTKTVSAEEIFMSSTPRKKLDDKAPLLVNCRQDRQYQDHCTLPHTACEAEIGLNFDQDHVSWASVILFLLSLGFHSFLTGLALGASDEQTTILFIAVMLHKGFAVFCFSSVVHRAKAQGSRWKRVLPLAAISLSTPLGIAVGLAWSPPEHSVAVAILLSLVGGTFLFIALDEVLHSTAEKLQTTSEQIVGYAALVIGYGGMSVLALWA